MIAYPHPLLPLAVHKQNTVIKGLPHSDPEQMIAPLGGGIGREKADGEFGTQTTASNQITTFIVFYFGANHIYFALSLIAGSRGSLLY